MNLDADFLDTLEVMDAGEPDRAVAVRRPSSLQYLLDAEERNQADGQAVKGIAAGEGDAVVRTDRAGQAEVLESALEDGEGIVSGVVERASQLIT